MTAPAWTLQKGPEGFSLHDDGGARIAGPFQTLEDAKRHATQEAEWQEALAQEREKNRKKALTQKARAHLQAEEPEEPTEPEPQPEPTSPLAIVGWALWAAVMTVLLAIAAILKRP
jgi:hypothetical protein